MDHDCSQSIYIVEREREREKKMNKIDMDI